MEMKTKKSLALNALGLAAGLAGFAAGLTYNLPVVGLAGFLGIVYGGTGVVDETIKGIAETIKYKKYQREMKKNKINEKYIEEAKQQKEPEEKIEENLNEQRFIEKAIEKHTPEKGDSDEGMSM